MEGLEWAEAQNSIENDPDAKDPLFSRTLTEDATGLTAAKKITATVKWTDSSGEHTISAYRIITP
jgi:hypothetical protein